MNKTNKRILTVVMLSCALLFSGCATHGATALDNESQSTLQKKLIRGKTTQEDVIAMYGQPQNIKKSNSGNTYVYVLSKTHSGDVFHSLDQKDVENIVQGASVGLITQDAGVGIFGAGSTFVAGRLGQADNKSDQSVDKSLIIKFNNQGILKSYSFH